VVPGPAREADDMKIAQQFIAGIQSCMNRQSVKRTAECHRQHRPVISVVRFADGRNRLIACDAQNARQLRQKDHDGWGVPATVTPQGRILWQKTGLFVFDRKARY
jgi:hypothetical protein